MHLGMIAKKEVAVISLQADTEGTFVDASERRCVLASKVRMCLLSRRLHDDRVNDSWR